MSEPKTLIIDGQSYDADAIDPQCREMLVAIQTGNQGIALDSAKLEAAKLGIEVMFNNAKKLLPDPLPVEVGAEDAKH